MGIAFGSVEFCVVETARQEMNGIWSSAGLAGQVYDSKQTGSKREIYMSLYSPQPIAASCLDGELQEGNEGDIR
jgi:hypothetical protein